MRGVFAKGPHHPIDIFPLCFLPYACSTDLVHPKNTRILTYPLNYILLRRGFIILFVNTPLCPPFPRNGRQVNKAAKQTDKPMREEIYTAKSLGGKIIVSYRYKRYKEIALTLRLICMTCTLVVSKRRTISLWPAQAAR